MSRVYRVQIGAEMLTVHADDHQGAVKVAAKGRTICGYTGRLSIRKAHNRICPPSQMRFWVRRHVSMWAREIWVVSEISE